MSGRDFHHRATVVLSAGGVLLGLTLVVRTLFAGGGVVAGGVVMGVVLALLGALRLVVALRTR